MLVIMVAAAISFLIFNNVVNPSTDQTETSTFANNSSEEASSTTDTSQESSSEEPAQQEENPYEGEFELPVKNASGFAPIDLDVKSEADDDAKTQETLTPGTAFRILQEEGDWWEVESDEAKGWVQHQYAFINLPDVVPSAVYNNTNTYSSLYRSSGIDIPEVTNTSLYDGKADNERLQKEEFVIPVLYTTAKKNKRCSISSFRKR